MRQQLPVLIAVVVVLVLGALGYRLFFGADEAMGLRVMEARGEVQRVSATGRASAATVGDQVEPQERLTVGEGGRAVLGVGEGSQLTLEARSSIRVTSVEETGVRVELEEGRVQAKVSQGSTLLGIQRGDREVAVSDGAVAVTTGEGGRLRVEAEQGSADLSGFGDARSLSAGERLTLDDTGASAVEPVPDELLLEVSWPQAKATREEELVVKGEAPAFAQVRVGRAGRWWNTRADAAGQFSVVIELAEGENTVEVVVEDGFGGERRSTHVVERDTQAPQATRAEVVWGR